MRIINHIYFTIIMIYFLFTKQINGSSCKGNLFPTIYNCDFKTLITSENNKLENPNGAPVRNTTSGSPFGNFMFTFKVSPGESMSPVSAFLIDVEDILLLLTDNVKNNPLARLGSQGEIKWVKLFQILMNNGFICYYDKKIDVKDDIIFSLDVCFDGIDYSNVFSKISTNGTYFGKFNSDTKSNSKFSTNYNIYTIENLKVANNHDLILTGTTKYFNGALGVGLKSGYDTLMIKTDDNLNTKWIISVDINDSTDLIIGQQSEADIVYSMSINLKYVMCVFQLNYTTGEFIKSKCYQLISNSNSMFYGSALKDINVIKITTDRLITFIPIYTTTHSRLMFFSKTTLELLKTYYSLYYFIPVWYGYSESLNLDIMYFSTQRVIFRFLMDKESIEVLESYGVYREYHNYASSNITNIMIVNPSNSSDCGSDPTCFLKYIGTTLINQDSQNMALSIQLDKYNFDLRGTYCDQPIVFGSKSNYHLGEALQDESILTDNVTLPTNASLQYRNANYTMFISEMGYFTISELDLKDNMWPIFEPTKIEVCRFDLPSFILPSNSALIKIGKRTDLAIQYFKYIPFSHCRNTKFYFIVCNETYADGEECIQPDWISINSTEHSFSLLLSQVPSSGIKHIKLQAILVQMSLVDATDVLSTEIIDFYFNFINSNVELISYDTNPYVVFNQMKTFNFTLSDEENDELLVKIVDPGALSLYVQRLPSNNQFQLVAISQDATYSNQTVVLQYTDSYHQDPTEWKNLTLSISVYPSEPPRFVTPLKDVLISACDQISISIPDVEDIDSEHFWIELDSPTPSWISLVGNKTLSVDALNSNLTRMQTSQIVTFKLSDDSGAVVYPKTKLLIDTSMLIEFKHIDKIKAAYSQIIEFDVLTGIAKDVRLLECESLQPINWGRYNQTTNKMMLNLTDLTSIGNHCGKIVAVDGCGKTDFSNNFNIEVIVKKPPSILGEFNPVKLMRGERRLFEYSQSMFHDEEKSKLIYGYSFTISSVGFSYPTVKLSEDNSNLYLLIEGTVVGEFYLALQVTDYINNTSEASLEITVYNCASIDCVKCSGIYEKDCTMCTQDFQLEENTGKCYNRFIYWQIDEEVYLIIGVIAFCVIVLNICTIFKTKRLSFLLLIYNQTILIFLMSANDIHKESKAFANLLVNFNLSLDFMSPNFLNKIINCSNNSVNMRALHFYCNSTLLNYKFGILTAVIILFVFIFANIIFKKIKLKESSIVSKIFTCRFISKINITRYDISWLVFHVVGPFLIITLMSDIKNFKSHYIWGSISALIILSVVLLLIVVKLRYVRSEFILKLDPVHPYIYSYCCFVRMIVHSILFLFGSSTNYNVLYLCAFIINVLVFLVQSLEYFQRKFGVELNLHQRKEKILNTFGESCLLIIIPLIWMFNSAESELIKSLYYLILLFYTVFPVISLISTRLAEKSEKDKSNE